MHIRIVDGLNVLQYNDPFASLQDSPNPATSLRVLPIATITICRNVLLQDYKLQANNDIHDYFHCTRVRIVNSTNESVVRLSQLQNHHARVQGETTHTKGFSQ